MRRIFNMNDDEPRGRKIRAISLLASSIVWLALGVGALWGFGALWFDFPEAEYGPTVALVFGVVTLLVAVLVRPRWWAKLGIGGVVVCLLVWWFAIPPRQYRDWKTGCALTAHAVIEGDTVTIHNVRNFDYRTEMDFTPRYERRRFDLANLRGMDLFINYWGSPYMAHPIVSFDFGADGRVCFSIETRTEKGEGYSALGGLYRQFELACIVADERDVVRLRSNYRTDEDVYLYRLAARGAREAFLAYVRTVNELHESPRWYHAVTNNCTTAIRHQRAASERSSWDWRMLVNGYADELLYERGGIDRSLPFDELKRRSHINERAKAADQSPDFSKKIREGLPGMPQDD